jgi:hypothetical protein
VLVSGCAGYAPVERAYSGNVVEGRYISPDAYASFLSGAIAEASGDLARASTAYAQALGLDEESVELWTRLADVKCRRDTRDAGADDAFRRALERDPGYARAWAAKARCLSARGDVAGARDAAQRAAQLDPEADGANAMLAVQGPSDAATRERLVALTLTAGDAAVAWDALASWAEAHGDVVLWARALCEVARQAPGRRLAIARSAELLAGMGALPEARAVASAAVEAGGSPLGGSAGELARRLAVDHAIDGGDVEKVRRAASLARLPLDEVAGRALLSGKRELARSLAELEAGADQGSRGARWVLAVCTGDDLVAAAGERKGDVRPSGAAVVAFGMGLGEAAVERARSAVATVAEGGILPGDDRVVRPAVELVSRRVLDAGALPADGRVELAALRGEKPAPVASTLDARHEYLLLAMTDPASDRARALGARLSLVAPSDPVVQAAQALVLLGSGAPVDPELPRRLLARAPGDALLAAMALRLAEKAGDVRIAGQARATLSAILRTPASVE